MTFLSPYSFCFLSTLQALNEPFPDTDATKGIAHCTHPSVADLLLFQAARLGHCPLGLMCESQLVVCIPAFSPGFKSPAPTAGHSVMCFQPHLLSLSWVSLLWSRLFHRTFLLSWVIWVGTQTRFFVSSILHKERRNPPLVSDLLYPLPMSLLPWSTQCTEEVSFPVSALLSPVLFSACSVGFLLQHSETTLELSPAPNLMVTSPSEL